MDWLGLPLSAETLPDFKSTMKDHYTGHDVKEVRSLRHVPPDQPSPLSPTIAAELTRRKHLYQQVYYLSGVK